MLYTSWHPSSTLPVAEIGVTLLRDPVTKLAQLLRFGEKRGVMSYCFVGNIISETWLLPKSVEKGRRESEQCHIAMWKAQQSNS